MTWCQLLCPAFSSLKDMIVMHSVALSKLRSILKEARHDQIVPQKRNPQQTVSCVDIDSLFQKSFDNTATAVLRSNSKRSATVRPEELVVRVKDSLLQDVSDNLFSAMLAAS
jgi:hypothetical protein